MAEINAREESKSARSEGVTVQTTSEGEKQTRCQADSTGPGGARMVKGGCR